MQSHEKLVPWKHPHSPTLRRKSLSFVHLWIVRVYWTVRFWVACIRITCRKATVRCRFRPRRNLAGVGTFIVDNMTVHPSLSIQHRKRITGHFMFHWMSSYVLVGTVRECHQCAGVHHFHGMLLLGRRRFFYEFKECQVIGPCIFDLPSNTYLHQDYNSSVSLQTKTKLGRCWYIHRGFYDWPSQLEYTA